MLLRLARKTASRAQGSKVAFRPAVQQVAPFSSADGEDGAFGNRGWSDGEFHSVEKTLEDGLRTPDIMSKGKKKVSTSDMGDAIISNLN